MIGGRVRKNTSRIIGYVLSGEPGRNTDRAFPMIAQITNYTIGWVSHFHFIFS